MASLLVSRIKVMARLDIAEKAYRRMAVLRCCWAVGRLTSVIYHAFRLGRTGGAATAGQKQARLTLERLGLSLELTAQLRSCYTNRTAFFW